ncbi:MFS transporter [Bremerella sp. JC817]|uniref:MFS transporter n=1 Tax=Bremerella sp. JC817 TaxID=3231756 RepID=UPI0034594F73
MDAINNPYESPRNKAASVKSIPEHLSGDPSFYATTATQFFGAFNDNIFKQLLLLVAVNQVIQEKDGTDYQGLAMVVFAAPFVLFAGPTGYLADKFSKTTIIRVSKVLEIVAMVLGVAAFYWYDQLGMTGLMIVLAFMGFQSTLFAPAKYGILPELFHGRDLPKVNGVFLMTTFLAIIFGTVLAGILCDWLPNNLWIASTVCVGVAVVGTLTTLPMRHTPPATPDVKFTPQAAGIPKKTRELFLRDHAILKALLASCMFWLCAGIVQQAVNSLGKVQLELSDTRTSWLGGAIGLGIGLGCMLAGVLSSGKIEFKLVRIGAWGIVGCLGLMALPGGQHGQLLGLWGSLPVLILLGIFTGMFSVPIQVYLQAKAPEDQKGQVIAEMSRANWLAIFLSGFLYSIFDQVLIWGNMPRCYLFGFTLLIMLPVALLYHPKSEALDTEKDD